MSRQTVTITQPTNESGLITRALATSLGASASSPKGIAMWCIHRQSNTCHAQTESNTCGLSGGGGGGGGVKVKEEEEEEEQ